ALASLARLPVGLHNRMHSARLQPPCQSFAPALLALLRRLAQPGHRPSRNAAAVDPVLHGASLGPRPEMQHAITGVLPPAGQRQAPASRGDALAHTLDLALVLAAEGVISLDLSDIRHASLSRRDAVFALASAHADRSTSGATGPLSPDWS